MSIHSSKESEGLFRCDARSKAGSTYIVYRVAVVTPATIKNLIMHLNGGSYEVGKEIEVKVKFLSYLLFGPIIGCESLVHRGRTSSHLKETAK